MNRNQIKSVLKINGYTEEASDDEIRAVLQQAKYSESEIEKAMVILRQKDVAPMIRSDGLHTVFYTDGNLKPSEIAGLLGIEVNFEASHFKKNSRNTDTFNFHEVLIIMGLSALIAFLSIVIYSYINKIGYFHGF